MHVFMIKTLQKAKYLQIRPEERKMANLAGYFDTYVEKERMFLGGRMSFCNNVTMNGSGRRIWCG